MMKKICMYLLAFSLILSVCLSALTVSAEKFDWQSGIVPENWEDSFVDEQAEVTATHILDPVNPNASPECRSLYAYLCQLRDTQTFLTGQFDLNGDARAYNWIVDDYGIEPALYSTSYDMQVVEPVWDSEQEGKLLNTPISFSDVDEANAMLKQHYDNGNVLLIHSDRAYRDIVIDLLIEKGVYPDVMGMIKEFDMTNPDRDMQAYTLWREHLRQRNAALKKLEDSGVKAYMFRELVEFNIHGMFLGGNSGSHFARVYQQHVQSMIDDGLTGFLSTYSPAARYQTLSHNPGNEYVDVYSVTLYSPEERKGGFDGNVFTDYEWYMQTGKPIGFSEFSCRMDNYIANIPVAYQSRSSWFTTLKDVVSYWPGLTWVNCWGDSSYSLYNLDESGGGNDDGLLFLDSPYTLNLSEIPDYRHTAIRAPGIAQFYTNADAAGEYRGMEQRRYTAADLKEIGVDITDLRAVRLNTGYAVTFYSGEDCTGKSWSYAMSQETLPADTVAAFRSCEITPTPCVSFEKDIWASDNDEESWKANDGGTSMWKGRVDSKGTAWLYIDLGTPHIITRYTVKTAGFAGMVTMYNLRDFQVQYSSDAVNWKTVSTVSENTDSQISRNLYGVEARYFRLLITGANSYVGNNPDESAIASVAEFELYGAASAAADTTDIHEDKDTPQEDTPREDIAPDNTLSQQDVSDPADASEDTPAEDSVSSDAPSQEDAEGDAPLLPEDAFDGEDSSGEEEARDEESSEKTPSGKKPVRVVTTQVWFPWWGWLLIALGVAAVGGVLVFVVRKRRKSSVVTE